MSNFSTWLLMAPVTEAELAAIADAPARLEAPVGYREEMPPEVREQMVDEHIIRSDVERHASPGFSSAAVPPSPSEATHQRARSWSAQGLRVAAERASKQVSRFLAVHHSCWVLRSFFEAGLWTCFLSCCKGFDEICRKFKWGSCLVCGRARHPRDLRSGRWQGHLRLVCNRFGKHDSKGGRPCWRHDAFDPQKYPLPADVKAAPHAFISVDLSVVGRKLVRKNLNMFAERHWRYSDLFYSLQRNRQHSNV